MIINDSNVCDKMDDNKLKDDCQRKFLSNIFNETIEKTNESAIVKDSKEILNKALISHNSSICLSIADNTTKTQCKAILK